MQLTPEGRRLLGYARRIEAEFNAAQRAVAEEPGERPPGCRLGVLHSILGAAIATAIGALPPSDRCGIEIVYGSERDLIGTLECGRIDVALSLTGRGSDRFAEQIFLTEDYAIAIAKSHPLGDRDQIAAEEIADETMIVRRHCEALAETSWHFTERGMRPPFALRSTNDDRVLLMVAAGLGLTVMPASYVYAGVARPRLTEFVSTRSISFWFNRANVGAETADVPLVAQVAQVPTSARKGQVEELPNAASVG